MTHQYLPVYRQPDERESLIGFSSRLMQANGYDSLVKFMHILGVAVVPETFYRPDGQRRVLKALTTFTNPRFKEQLSQAVFRPVREALFRVKGIRICPECVAQEIPHSNRFQHTYVTVCDHHGCFLQDSCAHCEHPIGNVLQKQCTHCYQPFQAQSASLTRAHQQLIDNLYHREDIEWHVFRWCQFFARPHDLVDAAISTRVASPKDCHFAFQSMSAVAYDKRERAAFFSKVQKQLKRHCDLGKGELAYRQDNLRQIENSIANIIDIDIPCKRPLSQDDIKAHFTPMLKTDYYARRGVTIVDDSCAKLCSKAMLCHFLKLEHKTIHYLVKGGVLPTIRSTSVNQEWFDIEQVRQQITINIPEIPARAMHDYVRFSDINGHVLDKYLLSLGEVFEDTVNGRIEAVRTKLSNNENFLDTVYLKLDSLQTYCEDNIANYADDVSLKHFASILTVSVKDLLHAHDVKPFDGLDLNKAWLRPEEVQNFFRQYISVTRVEYLTKLDAFELRDYLDSFPSEKHDLQSTNEKTYIYKRSQSVDAVINDLQRQGRLSTKFKFIKPYTPSIAS